MKRRTMLGCTLALCAGLKARLVSAVPWSVDAFSATSLGAAMQALFGARTPEASRAIALDVEPRIENGAVVPIEVRAEIGAVRTIDVFAELNPNPLIARFHLSPRCRPVIATRIKVGAPSHVIAVAETETGLLEARQFVEVAEGGCG